MWLLDIATSIMRKNIKLFPMCAGYNSCTKVKYIWKSHFPKDIITNMLIGNDFFVFKYTVGCKKYFQILYIYIEIKFSVWLNCAQPIMTSIIVHNRRPISNFIWVLWFYVSADVLLSQFEELKSTFSTSLHFTPRGMY
jgi:hypothetical protein